MGVRLSYGENDSGFEWKRERVCRGCICILHSWETACFVEKIPLTASGKPDKMKAKEILSSRK